ncbi:hypothetical protein RHMOL_Rhmol05G0110800 [Rhododendron molle]|uniref:Uncharacterized protein n=1 Tax=Rhododendron molle TaxID=49168 RepID=A0ACC0NPW5_RHOML|nr:hypothetical protein RHMOL_Rhmol05G0110800 [Rhododendron molle]
MCSPCVMMVAAVTGAAAAADPQNPNNKSQNDGQQQLQQQNPNKRPPFKSRQVSSRYMSPSSSSASVASSNSTPTRRCPSPLVSRNSNPTPNTPIPAPKRAVSADRRRPTTPSRFEPRLSNAGEVSAATKLLVTSTRSLSVSFQGEAFSLPISKTKAAPTVSNVRKGTPERRSVSSSNGNSNGTSTSARASTPIRGGDQAAESLAKSIDQHRWPGRNRQMQQPNSLSRSLDCPEDKMKLIGSGKNGNNVVRALQKSMVFDEGRRASFDGRLSLDLGSAELLRAIQKGPNGNNSVSESSVVSDLAASDSDRDSVSSGSTSGLQECSGGGAGSMKGRNAPRGIAVSARFWQETNSRLRRLNDPGSPLLSTSPAKMVVPPKFGQSKKFPSDSTLSSPRTMSSPIRGGGIRPASPSKTMTPSPARGMTSPSRVRSSVSGTISSSFGETPSVLSFAVDVRRGKVGENRLGDAHLLRLLYNRHLQWRFVNARTEAALLVQRNSAEKNLWNAWITTSDLRDSVTKKRHRLQLLRQKLKLASILKGEVIWLNGHQRERIATELIQDGMEKLIGHRLEITCLEDWACLDKDHSVSLLGAIEALKASTLRLPVVGGAIADVQSVKDAIGSAVDVMQAMSYSMYSLLMKVEEVNSLVAELVKVISKERALLEQCKDFLSMLAAMQVKYFSLRTQILQLTRVPTA